MDIIKQSACLVINLIMVYSYGFLLLQEGGPGLGINNNTVGGWVPHVCLRLGPPWLSWRFSLALKVCVLKAFFFVSSQFVN